MSLFTPEGKYIRSVATGHGEPPATSTEQPIICYHGPHRGLVDILVPVFEFEKEAITPACPPLL